MIHTAESAVWNRIHSLHKSSENVGNHHSVSNINLISGEEAEAGWEEGERGGRKKREEEVKEGKRKKEKEENIL